MPASRRLYGRRLLGSSIGERPGDVKSCPVGSSDSTSDGALRRGHRQPTNLAMIYEPRDMLEILKRLHILKKEM